MESYFIKSKRLGFRPYNVDDANMIINWINNEEINKFFVQYMPHTYEKMTQVIKRMNSSNNEMGFIIDILDSKESIGILEIKNLDLFSKNCEIEFAIGEKNFWNKGFGTEILFRVEEYLFNSLGIHKINFHVMSSNVYMVELAKKLNYNVEGILREEWIKNNQYCDVLRFFKIKHNIRNNGPLSHIPSCILDIIGKTPVVELSNITESVNSRLFAKLEFYNPSGSVKDRAAYNIIKTAEKKGLINKGTTVVEATSGNLGIALATVCAVKKLKLIVTAPNGVIPKGKLSILNALGAEIIFTPIKKSYGGAVNKAKEIAQSIKNSFMSNQFSNPANYLAHTKSTANEIIQQFGDNLDSLILTIGSGGTITGVGKVLKKLYPKIKIIAVEPKNCTILSEPVKVEGHYILGIGPGFVPDILDTNIIDDVITVSDEEATHNCIELARKEGIFCGISSGAAISASLKYSSINDNENILTILPDNGVRYVGKKGFFMDNLHKRFAEEGLIKFDNCEKRV